MQGTDSIDVGSDVWVQDSDVAWVDGMVIDIKGEDANIETTNGKTVSAKLSKLYLKDASAPSRGVDDMTRLLYLHEPGILHNLAARYELNEIYTYTGNILIAVNPFQSLSHLYDDQIMEQYKGKPLAEISPHVYAIAEAAYRAMINEQKSNSILVSGESGAGKTETTKMLMRYLAYLGGNRSPSEGRSVEQKVLESNPVLEAFGNAKTVRNNNSSRFGKFVEIQFDKKGRISGAAVRTYLLEKSRVCQISDPERNYHCFYLVCAAPPEDIEKYKLGNPNSFHYLNQSNCYQLVGVNDAGEYLATRKAMDIVGICEQDQDAIFRIVAAILHLGNVDFAKNEEVDSSVLKDEKSKFHLQMTAELLMCELDPLEDTLLNRVMVTRGERIKKSLDPVGSTVSRDGLAKTIYSCLFNWLVDKINLSLGQDAKSTFLIGVLDIYGFESFQSNSFEQFCINFTNEKLQQHFNQHVFKMDQEEYTKEEISWSYIDFVDNKDILDLIEKRPGGIISLLDEACMFPRSTHETFADKLYQTFNKHKRFIRPKLTRSDFTIVHYAGEVRYQSDLFLDKNKDYVVPEHQALLSASKCSFVAGLFPPVVEAPKTSKFSSIGSRFKQQLQQLMDTLNSTKPHYIRCVKPNSLLKPGIYENFSVLQQLRSSGVLEAIKIKCGGFPSRMTFEEFLNRFAVLAKDIIHESAEDNVKCKRILDSLEIAGYRIGKTKVFLRPAQMAELDARKSRVVRSSAQIILGLFKTNASRKQFVLMRKASILVQTNWRGKVARKKRMQMRREKASINIQKNYRRLQAKRNYDDVKASAIIVQAGLRGMTGRIEFRIRTRSKAAKIIQAYWRGYTAFSYYKNLRRATHFMQCRWKRQKGLRYSTWPPEPEKAEEQNTELEENSVLEMDVRLVKELEAEANTLLHNEYATVKAIEETCSVIEEQATDDVAKIRSLTAENRNLKALLDEERQRADELDRKYAEAHETSEKRRKKLKETEKRVKKLQVSLKRMIYSMSDQFSELKTILRASSNSTSTSGQIAKDDKVDATSNNSEDSSVDSEVTSLAQAPTSVNISTLSSDALQVMVQDITGVDISGTGKRDGEEGAFDDFF